MLQAAPAWPQNDARGGPGLLSGSLLAPPGPPWTPPAPSWRPLGPPWAPLWRPRAPPGRPRGCPGPPLAAPERPAGPPGPPLGAPGPAWSQPRPPRALPRRPGTPPGASRAPQDDPKWRLEAPGRPPNAKTLTKTVQTRRGSARNESKTFREPRPCAPSSGIQAVKKVQQKPAPVPAESAGSRPATLRKRASERQPRNAENFSGA